MVAPGTRVFTAKHLLYLLGAFLQRTHEVEYVLDQEHAYAEQVLLDLFESGLINEVRTERALYFGITDKGAKTIHAAVEASKQLVLL